MLDLKAKLASAGLVTQEEIARAEASKGGQRTKKPSNRPQAPAARATTGQELPLAKLRGKPKSEIYDTIRKWVEHYRLDPIGGIPSETAEPYHFVQPSGKVGRLTLEAEVLRQLRAGEAGIVAYMSNHGLAHAVVPAATARSLAEIYPLWLRVLEGDSRAGAVEPKTTDS